MLRDPPSPFHINRNFNIIDQSMVIITSFSCGNTERKAISAPRFIKLVTCKHGERKQNKCEYGSLKVCWRAGVLVRKKRCAGVCANTIWCCVSIHKWVRGAWVYACAYTGTLMAPGV